MDYYSSLHVAPGQYYENYVSILTWSTKKQLEKLQRTVKEIKGEWDMAPTSVNAYYVCSTLFVHFIPFPIFYFTSHLFYENLLYFQSRTDNDIIFPAGILQPPFFDAELPDYINYGALAMFIGHELSVSLYSKGKNFPFTHSPINLSTNYTYKNTLSNVACI